ncbi:hypothetical protein M2336_001871 [Sphingobium sp. B1D7B]|nr:hypothetical protein [Sphingobium sp. B1D7B]MCW2405242.1 hypothetical protein [Sphingobium sp. B1D7B]
MTTTRKNERSSLDNFLEAGPVLAEDEDEARRSERLCKSVMVKSERDKSE